MGYNRLGSVAASGTVEQVRFRDLPAPWFSSASLFPSPSNGFPFQSFSVEILGAFGGLKTLLEDLQKILIYINTFIAVHVNIYKRDRENELKTKGATMRILISLRGEQKKIQRSNVRNA
jgi:hypothetical protein